MKIEIKSWFDESVLFSIETDSWKLAVEAAVKSRANLSCADLSRADLPGANLSGANLFRADLSDSDLSTADLSRAHLSRANLYCADLSRADLSGANLSGANLSGEILDKTPLQILGTTWEILLTEKNIKIGCQFHSAEEWFSFDDYTIAKMDDKALDWWKIWKPILKLTHEEHCN